MLFQGFWILQRRKQSEHIVKMCVGVSLTSVISSNVHLGHKLLIVNIFIQSQRLDILVNTAKVSLNPLYNIFFNNLNHFC